MFNRTTSARISLFLFALVSMLTQACGDVSYGPALPPKDPVPTGKLVAQGSFVGKNGKTVSGTAAIYNVDGSNSYVARVEDLAAPSESNLYLVATANGQDVMTAYLRALNGTQNYTFTAAGVQTWSTLSIRSSVNVTTPEYGTALLTVPGK